MLQITYHIKMWAYRRKYWYLIIKQCPYLLLEGQKTRLHFE